jgi:hypothetical protein
MLDTTDPEKVFLREQVKNLTSELKALREQVTVLTAQLTKFTQPAAPAPSAAPAAGKKPSSSRPAAKARKISAKQNGPKIAAAAKGPAPVSHGTKIPATDATTTDPNSGVYQTVPAAMITDKPIPDSPAGKRKLDSSIDSSDDDSTPAAAPAALTGPKVPPVVLHKQEDYRAIIQLFKTNDIKVNEVRTRPGGVSIHLATPTDYRRAQNILDLTGVHHHTYATDEEKTTNVVFRGIPISQGIEDDIREELVASGFSVHSVARMSQQRKPHNPMPLVLVKLQRSPKTKEVFAITKIANLRVSVEKAHPKKTVGQCFRCQQFGHAQSGCKGEVRCVKCSTPGHWSAECPKTKTEQATCCNCGGPHPANYLGCPSHPKNKSARAIKRTEAARPSRTLPPSRPVQDGIRWASIAAPPTVPTATAPTSTEPTTPTPTNITPDEKTLALRFIQFLRTLSPQ